MAKKKIWLGMTAALLLAFGSVLVSCGSSCTNDGDCKTTAGQAALASDFCSSADCASFKEYTKNILTPNNTAASSCDC